MRTGSKFCWDLCRPSNIKCYVFTFSKQKYSTLSRVIPPASRLHLQLLHKAELNMWLIQVHTNLPQLRGSKSVLARQQGVLHAIFLADVKDGVSML